MQATKQALHSFKKGDAVQFKRFARSHGHSLGIVTGTIANETKPYTRFIRVACMINNCKHWVMVRFDRLERIES